MKQTLIEVMNAMMPFMRPLVFLAALLVALAAGMRLVGHRRSARVFAGTSVLIGIFFLACEGMGRLLGFEPTILFADPLDRQLYRNQFPFWLIGLTIFALAWLVRMAASPPRSH
jgi:hypothetical protein